MENSHSLAEGMDYKLYHFRLKCAKIKTREYEGPTYEEEL